MPTYSIIVPVYNRPTEVDELLASLTKQTVKDFEVIIVEDGSTEHCESIVEGYADQLDVKYYFKGNSGQGFSRNYGFERSSGEWLIVFDSDCLIPSDYLQHVQDFIEKHDIDAYGGPDQAANDFTLVQKAISYSMTSVFTTGGIRGGKKRVGPYHPRSFNMGIRQEVFESTGGYILPKKGEDIEFSIRIIEKGFKTALIPDAYVFHKRRTNFIQFFKQLHFFGTARINIARFYPKELKLVHFFPMVFFLGFLATIAAVLFYPVVGWWGLNAYGLYSTLLILHSLAVTKSPLVAVLSVPAAFVQLIAYGMGFLKEGAIYLVRG